MLEITELAGIAIIVGGLAQIAIVLVFAVWRGTRAAAAQQTELTLFRERAQVMLQAARIDRDRHERSWSGWRKFEVADRVTEAEGIVSFYLAPHDERQIPGFLPGQYLTLRLRIPGSKDPVIRCYSLSDRPRTDNRYRITVKRIEHPGNGRPARPGLASSHLCNNIKTGDIIDIQPPSGDFCLDQTTERPVVFIAGGIGITPLFSMLSAIAASGSRRETWLFYGARNSNSQIMSDTLRDFERANENVHVVLVQSDPDGDGAAGDAFDERGHINRDLLERHLPSSNFTFFVCGPPAMMVAVVGDLSGWGVPDHDIRYEAFGPASLVPSASGEADMECEVVFDRSATSCRWTRDQGTLLELAEANGVPLPSGCRAGSCGACVTAVKKGEIRYTLEPSADPGIGSCLACVAVPAGPVTLDA